MHPFLWPTDSALCIACAAISMLQTKKGIPWGRLFISECQCRFEASRLASHRLATLLDGLATNVAALTVLSGLTSLFAFLKQADTLAATTRSGLTASDWCRLTASDWCRLAASDRCRLAASDRCRFATSDWCGLAAARCRIAARSVSGATMLR